MRFYIPAIDFETEVLENQVIKLTIEDHSKFAQILWDIWCQCNGGVGEFKLYDNDKYIKLSDAAVFVMNPFDCDANERKVLSKLYKDISTTAREMLPYDTSGFYTELITYMDRVAEIAPYSLTYDSQPDLVSIFKCLDLKINQITDTFIEKFMDYLRAYKEICHVDTCIAVNLKQYFSGEEIRNLYEFAFYEKINLIIFEGAQSETVPGEKCWIIDKDNCIIEAN